MALNQQDKAYLESEVGDRSRVVEVPNYFDDRVVEVEHPAALEEGSGREPCSSPDSL